MIPPILKIDGPFAGLDPLYVILGVVITVGVLGGVAVIARQVHAMTPKQPTPQQRNQAQKAQQAGAQYDQWTERPQQRRDYESQYYSLYGSAPARQGDFVSPRAPQAPTAPAAPGGDVVVTLSPQSAAMRPAPRPGAEGAPSPWASPSAFEPPGAQAPRVYPPPRASMAAGPGDDVVSPMHGRRAREVGLPTGQGAEPDPGTPPFERSSVRPGAAQPRSDPAFSPRANPPAVSAPPPLPPAPPAPPKITPTTPRTPPSVGRTAFARPVGEQAVVGGAGMGLQEGSDVTPQRKAIRCPKCSTVFPGPLQRPAMVKCPACGTGGMLK